jgi:hypothetical protein
MGIYASGDNYVTACDDAFHGRLCPKFFRVLSLVYHTFSLVENITRRDHDEYADFVLSY